MKRVIYDCDFCHKEITDDIKVLRMGKMLYGEQFAPEDFEDGYKERHYHKECLDKLMRYVPEDIVEEPSDEPEPLPIDFAEVPEEGKAEEEKPEPKPEKPKQTRKSRKDLGKVKAMHEAGASNTEIAKEFDVSLTTIANWLREIADFQDKMRRCK